MDRYLERELWEMGQQLAAFHHREGQNAVEVDVWPVSVSRSDEAPTSDPAIREFGAEPSNSTSGDFEMPNFTPRQRKRKVLDRQRDRKNGSLSGPPDANSIEIIPESKTDREGRRQRLKEELKARQPEGKLSRKKQKRLDKYIDKKLKKEENLELIKKLESQKVDTSLYQSSKRLGQATETKRELLQRALRERNAGFNVLEAETVLFEPHREADSEDERTQAGAVDSRIDVQLTARGTTVGSGLKRPLDLSEHGRPIVRKRRRRSNASPVQVETFGHTTENDHEDESDWAGFSEDGDSLIGFRSDQYQELESSRNDGEYEADNKDELRSPLSFDKSEEKVYEEGDTDTSAEDTSKDERPEKRHSSGFKAWAEQQRNKAVGFTPSNVLNDTTVLLPKIPYTPQPLDQDPLPPELEPTTIDRKAYAVPVTRSDEVQNARLALPVLAEEQRIMEAIFSHDVVVISGATGSGKTTQVPQFLFENGFGDPGSPTPGMIGVTQPRRVAAVSMAKRVGDELQSARDRVSYQIRFDTTVSRKTAIKFMTDGVLLREMSADFALKKYSVIVVDEAHERTVNTDILISYLSRAIRARSQLAKEKPLVYYPLKLVIMSATLRVSDFRENSRLFSVPPPLLDVEGRQYQVTHHWSRKTPQNWLDEAFKKVRRGHRKLPPGGILVFLTGQNEIRALSKRLKFTFPSTDRRPSEQRRFWVNPKEMQLEDEDLEAGVDADATTQAIGDVDEQESWSDLDTNASDDEEFDITEEAVEETTAAPQPPQMVHVLPLYSQLASEEQLKVFEAPPEGSRLIVLATNIAETSLTIPGIRYVFDCGRVKERKWDAAGVQTYETTWISKASADQRAGRAGRTGPGHCYRLYSSAMYEEFAEFAEPEIYRSPLEGVVLQLKALGVSKIDNFPFPTAPSRSALLKAETLLTHLGALDAEKRIAPLGRELQSYPLNPRFAQMLRLGVIHNCFEPAIALVAALDLPEILIPESQLELRAPIWTEEDSDPAIMDEIDANKSLAARRRKEYGWAHAHLSRFDRSSDVLKLYTAISDHSRAEDAETASAYCRNNFLREKAVLETYRLRAQLTAIVRHHHPLAIPGDSAFSPKLPDQMPRLNERLKLLAAAGFIDQVAMRADLLPNAPAAPRKPRRAIDVRYRTLLPSVEGKPQTADDAFVFLHPSSALARHPPDALPPFLVYHRLQRSAPAHGLEDGMAAPTPKTRLHPLTPVSAVQLAALARGSGLIAVGKPIGRVEVLERRDSMERRRCRVEIRLVPGHGSEGVGWFLRTQLVVQRRVVGQGWVVEAWEEEMGGGKGKDSGKKAR